MVRVEAVTRLDALIKPFFRIAPLIRNHAALARAGRGAGHGSATRQRCFCFIRERTETHAGYVDRDIQIKRTLGTRANDGASFTFLAVAFDDEARQGAGHKGEIIPGRDFLEQRQPSHTVAAKLGLDVDVIDHIRRKNEAFAEDGFVTLFAVASHDLLPVL